MNPPGDERRDKVQYAYNLTLVAVAGQVGCLTLVIVIASLLAGLWLDLHFGTRPWVTLGMLVLSIPISLAAMFVASRSAAEKLKSDFERRRDGTITKEDAVEQDS